MAKTSTWGAATVTCRLPTALVLAVVLAPTAAMASDTQLEAAWSAWERGRFTQAQSLAEELLRVDSADSEARHLLVLTTFVAGRYADGLSEYARIDPGYERLGELHGLVVDAHQALGRPDRAAAVARKAGEPEPIVAWIEAQGRRPLRVNLERTTVLPFSRDHMIPDWMPAVPIELNGKEYLGHLDTGGTWVHMSPKMAGELGIETAYLGQGRGNEQETRLEGGIADRLRLGDAVLENVPVVVLESLQGALQDSEGRIEDLVILGTSVLEQFLTTWDNERQRLVLSPRQDPAARREHFEEYVPDGAQPMDFYMVPDHYLIGHGAIAGADATFFVDTGLVTVDEKGRQPGLGLTAESFARFGGQGEITETRLTDSPGPLRLGPVELGNQAVRVTPDSRGYSFSGVRPDALLSYGFLKHCVWTLDFDTRTWYLYSFRDPVAAADPVAEVRNPDEYAGSYEIAPGLDLEVTASDGTVYLQAPGQQQIALEPDGTDVFQIRLAGAKIVFERDEAGAVTVLVLHQMGNATRATRKSDFQQD